MNVLSRSVVKTTPGSIIYVHLDFRDIVTIHVFYSQSVKSLTGGTQ